MPKEPHICLKTYPTSQAALSRLKEHGCVYLCIANPKHGWHTNHLKEPKWNESYHSHVMGYTSTHEKKKKQKQHCQKCHKGTGR